MFRFEYFLFCIKTMNSNDPFEFAIHITFIEVNGKKMPFNVSVTSVIRPFLTKIIGLDTIDLNMNYRDIEKNCKRVNGFPRPSNMKLDFTFPVD